MEQLDKGVLGDLFRPRLVTEHQRHGPKDRRELSAKEGRVVQVGVDRELPTSSREHPRLWTPEGSGKGVLRRNAALRLPHRAQFQEIDWIIDVNTDMTASKSLGL